MCKALQPQGTQSNIVSASKALIEGGDKLHKKLLESIECAKGLVHKCLRIQEGHLPLANAS